MDKALNIAVLDCIGSALRDLGLTAELASGVAPCLCVCPADRGGGLKAVLHCHDGRSIVVSAMHAGLANGKYEIDLGKMWTRRFNLDDPESTDDVVRLCIGMFDGSVEVHLDYAKLII